MRSCIAPTKERWPASHCSRAKERRPSVAGTRGRMLVDAGCCRIFHGRCTKVPSQLNSSYRGLMGLHSTAAMTASRWAPGGMKRGGVPWVHRPGLRHLDGAGSLELVGPAKQPPCLAWPLRLRRRRSACALGPKCKLIEGERGPTGPNAGLVAANGAGPGVSCVCKWPVGCVELGRDSLARASVPIGSGDGEAKPE